jgi:cob(I)alamin adenosyltransferase
MAARKGPLTETKLDEMRRRIKATLLLKKLEDHVLEGSEMSATQIRAAETLLRKTMPDLQAIQHSGDPANPVQTVSRVELVPFERGTGRAT